MLLTAALRALRGVKQSPVHHPEGDALAHTMLCARAAGALALRYGVDARTLTIAALCHDLGKASTTVACADGRITSHGHEMAGVAAAQAIAGTLGADPAVIGCLVASHMQYAQASTPKARGRLLRKLADAGVSVPLYCALVACDHHGRAPLAGTAPADFLLD